MEFGPGPSDEELGTEGFSEVERNPDEIDVEAAISAIEVEDPSSPEIRSLDSDEVTLGEINIIPPTADMFPVNWTEAQPGMDLERARTIDRFFLEKARLLEAVNTGQNAVAVGMVCLNKDKAKDFRFGRVAEIVYENDPKDPNHPLPRFVLAYSDGGRETVKNVKPSYDLNAKELAKMPPEYSPELTVTYPTGDLTIGNYLTVKGVEHVGRVAYHLDQEVFPGQVGLMIRDADNRAHLVATAIENLEPRS